MRTGRERRRSGLFVAEGPREVERARAAGLRIVETYFAPALIDWGEGEPVSERVLAKMAYRGRARGGDRRRRGAAARAAADGSLYLVAVGIEKPGNLGAMARSAEAAGADALVVAEAKADVWNPNAIRASTGAVFTLPVVEATPRRDRRPPRHHRRGRRRARTTRYTDADLARPDRRSSSAPRTRASAPMARRGRRPGLDPRRPRERRQPERRHRRRDPPLRGGAAAWLSRDDVLRARAIVERHLARTPMLSSRTLGARLKCELFQRTGSFKSRGALVKLASLTDDERARGVISISAGNHAQAVAFAAAEYGVDALIVMWNGASEQKIEATRSYGAHGRPRGDLARRGVHAASTS